MPSVQPIKHHLLHIETLLRQHQLWQQEPPEPVLLQSQQPFCLDTLEPTQWLQWVLLPRFQQMLEAATPLPQNLVIAPYFEHSLDSSSQFYHPLITSLQQFDALFSADS